MGKAEAMSSDAEPAVRTLVARINAHDVAGIVASCSEGHRFVDGAGQTLTGREAIRDAWSGYLALFPDYRIDVEWLIADGALVLLAGSATGSVETREGTQRWRIPAAWRAQVRGELVDVWQVYADNTPVYDLLLQRSK
jgi:ketosteroid isomerase-like protein